jgi:hypothetical protein
VRLGILNAKAIANPRLGDDVLWTGWLGFNLVTQIANMDAQQVSLFLEGIAPHLPQKLTMEMWRAKLSPDPC